MSDNAEDKTLDQIARDIEHHAVSADDHIIKAALLMREARRRVDEGEAGETTWYTWAPKNIKLCPSRLRDLQRIAEADDPKKELERQRELTRVRAAKRRAKIAGQAWKNDKERVELIDWVKDAPEQQVSTLLNQARRLRDDMPTNPITTLPSRKHNQAA